MDIQKLIQGLGDILGGKKQKGGDIADLLTTSPGSLAAKAINTAGEEQQERGEGLEVSERTFLPRKEVAFPDHLGLSEEYKDLILQRIDRPGPGALMNGYPTDECSDGDTYVDRNLLARELLWASRRDENASISISLGDEAARLLEINVQQADDVSSDIIDAYSRVAFPCDTLRIFYSKRKDWANAARVMDTMLEKGKSSPHWNEDSEADWENKRAKIKNQGY
jgi:hypothetical protein